MSRTCTICTHREREAIDRALVAGEAANALAARYCTVGRMALQRHAANHLPAALAEAHEAEQAAHGDDLLARLDALSRDAHRIKDRAEAEGDLRTALAGIRELVRIVEVLAELRGALDRRPVTIITSPEWLAVRSALLAVLVDYPEARMNVAARLLALEAEDGNGHAGG
jgi:hypothetical protein